MRRAIFAPQSEPQKSHPMTEIHPPKPVKSALDLIGNTPMVELTQFDTGPCQLFVKLENQNPRRFHPRTASANP